MPLDRHAQRLLSMTAMASGHGPGSPAQRRRGLESLRDLAEDEADAAVTAHDLSLEGPASALPARLYRPATADTAAPLPGLVFLHGGGWVAGDLSTHDGLCRRLCAASGAAILALDYRRPPEHPFPAAFDDALAAIRQTAARAAELGIDAGRLGVAGDSVGGGLAAAAALRLRDEGGPSLALLLLICPILDVPHESASRVALAEGFFLDRATMLADLDDYLGAGDAADPRVSPLLAPDLAGLPPTLIHTAEFDPFRDEAHAFAARLTAAGGRAETTDHAGMIHYFYCLPRAIPHARDAASMIGAQVRKVLGA